jgi:hypothetical protein
LVRAPRGYPACWARRGKSEECAPCCIASVCAVQLLALLSFDAHHATAEREEEEEEEEVQRFSPCDPQLRVIYLCDDVRWAQLKRPLSPHVVLTLTTRKRGHCGPLTLLGRTTDSVCPTSRKVMTTVAMTMAQAWARV